MTEAGSIGIVYSSWVSGAAELAQTLAQRVGRGGKTWVCPVPDLGVHEGLTRETRLLVTVGGDGTILRAVRLAAPLGVPLLGVNMGRVGFMTELSAVEAPERIEAYAQGEGWVEERTMLEARVVPKDTHELRESDDSGSIRGLNDAVVGRSGVVRMVHIDVSVDGQPVATYSCDAIIVATATGSTGYALSAGGPILYAESPSLLIKPVSPQLSLESALVLHPDRVVELTARSDHQAALSVDGYVDVPLSPGDVVQVRRSKLVARFLRTGPRPRLPEALARRLGSPPRSE